LLILGLCKNLACNLPKRFLKERMRVAGALR
jgi:hypothetical protein